MTRPIDADALRATIMSKKNDMVDLWDFAFVLNAINKAPTVPQLDFKEGYKQAIKDGKTNFSRPKGKWIFDVECWDNHAWFRCSECHAMERMEKDNLTAKFCWKCGADMRGDKE